MSQQFLDVSTMPFHQTYVCADGSHLDLRTQFYDLGDTIDAMAKSGVIQNNDSLGFAMLEPLSDPDKEHDEDFWDKPDEYVWFVGGWGKDRDTLIANAVRKLRPMLRSMLHGDYEEMPLSTLDMRIDGAAKYFEDTVDSVDADGNHPWGDFPWGGAVAASYGEAFALFGAVSGFSEIEDDIVDKLILGHIAKPIILGLGVKDD